VPSRNDKPPDLPEARYFAVETSVYDTSKAASVAFSVTCFLENTKRWQRVKIPPVGAFLSLTAKVAGRTVDANQLALRVLDLAYLPRPASVPTAMPTPSSTPTTKRSARWEGRATPFTPSKRQRGSDSASLAESSYKNQLLQSTEGRSHVSISGDSPDSPANSPSHSPSPSTIAKLAMPTLASPVSLYILSQAQTARLGRIVIATPQRSILIKSKKLHLCSSPYVFPTI
jgi:hypothetical protein